MGHQQNLGADDHVLLGKLKLTRVGGNAKTCVMYVCILIGCKSHIYEIIHIHNMKIDKIIYK